MLNFSKINYRSFFGRLLRLPLRLIPKTMVLPILQGKLRGKKWVVGAGEHGYWLGSYELDKRLAFEREIGKGAVVYDIGANVGYYSILAAVLVGSGGTVVAFEPLPRNVHFLRRHVTLNHLGQVEVIEAAVSDQGGEAAFDLGASAAMGHIANEGELTVLMVSLDELLAEGELAPPDFIKVDVEGAEALVLSGAHQLLQDFHPTLFLDTHNREAHAATLSILTDLGYTFEVLDGKSLTETKELIAHHQSV